ncbi:hypothetical protein CSCA_4441 [Clostridium scatologenes]|uniref:Uncharacterized protein n=1 Tax=Clostridium scatologenes TaxID=1548 RepID=A0A0E3GS72_CLOSL|nr:hypothetical protein CSCA_4441 [Clostridium scatologenes]
MEAIQAAKLIEILNYSTLKKLQSLIITQLVIVSVIKYYLKTYCIILKYDL